MLTWTSNSLNNERCLFRGSWIFTGSKKCLNFTKIFTGSVVAQLKRNVVSPLLTLTKGPATLKGLVKLWRICGVQVLPGVQIDSKADHNSVPKLEAALPWWRRNLTCSSYDSNSCLPPRALPSTFSCPLGLATVARLVDTRDQQGFHGCPSWTMHWGFL